MNNKAINLKVFISFMLAALIVITGLISMRRSVKGSNDFDTFYTAGKAVLSGEGIYYKNEWHEESSRGGPFLYPPFAALFFALFAVFSLKPAAFLWNAFNVALFVMCIQGSLKILRIRGPELLSQIKWPDRILVTVLITAILLDNLTMAQANILVFSLTLFSLLLWTEKKEILSGFFLAAAVLMKLTPALFLLFFVFKKRWRVLGGFFSALVLLALILPTSVFGLEGNRLFHRQWAGRALKPQLINWVNDFKNQPPHPDKKTAQVLEKDRRTIFLIDKNQSLSATLTRLFLKDRPKYGYDPEPIYAARRYEKLPVLIPIPEKVLAMAIYAGQLILVMIIILNTLKSQSAAYIFPALLLGMTLLSPLARSHHYISWIFVYLAAFSISDPRGNCLKNAARIAALVYFLMALPYGKAAGMGTWANLILFLSWNAALWTWLFKLDPSKKVS